MLRMGEIQYGLGHSLTLFGNELVTSLTTSLAAGVIVSFLGTGIAWYLMRSRVWRPVIIVYLVAALSLPAPLLGVALIGLFNRPGLLGTIYDSPFILILGYILRFLPVGVLFMVAAIRAVPIEAENAAELEGYGRLGVFGKVVFPLCLPKVFVVFLVVTILSIGELPCSLLLTPPGHMTVGARFFSLIHYGLQGESAFLCLLTSCVVSIPFLGLLLLIRQSRTSAE